MTTTAPRSSPCSARQSPALAVLALCLATAACDAPRDRAGPGDGSVAPPFALRVLGVRSCPPLAHESLSTDIGRLGVEVEVEATGSEPIAANFFYGTLVDERQTSYSAYPGGCRPHLAAPPLSAGDRATGFVDFEVPSEATGFVLSYAPRLEDGKSATAEPVPLNR